MQQELDWGSTAESATEPGGAVLEGGVIFASAEEQEQRTIELLGQGAVVITLPPPTADARGRLGDLLEELVERELARLGAPSPYLAAWAAMPEDAQARLSDQLFRARSLGATGLVIALGTLRALARPVLSTDDSATLRWLAAETTAAPLVLLLDDLDTSLAAYSAPATLVSLLVDRRAPSTPPSALLPPEASCGAARPEHGFVPIVRTPHVPDQAHSSAAAVELMATNGRALDMDSDRVLDLVNGPESAVEPEHVVAVHVAGELDREPEHLPSDHLEEDTAADEEPGPAPRVEKPTPEPRASAHAEEAVAMEESEPREAAHIEEEAVLEEPEPVTAPVRMRRPTSDEWRTWTISLGTTRGAQALATFERLFTDSYVPLANAIADGLDDQRALRAHDDFRRTFERSYSDAFAQFGATNRRPRLVMDAFDVAAKQARLANARSAHVLVVDSLRWDLGCLVRDVIAREAAGAASLTSEMLLWSALPTTTVRQLETFARGLDALRAPASNEDATESLRGRAAEVVRRMRAGSRELYKLDLVPAMLEASPCEEGVSTMLAHIAEATAESILRHMALLPPRTLLFVCGDHGFSVDRRGTILTGGASPEEVLMPAQAWLVGALH